MTNKTAWTALHAAKDVARNPYAWPGGYPRFLVTTDGGVLCPACCKKEFRQIACAAITRANDGWEPAAHDINWENPDLYCDHCNAHIESAYGEEE